MQDVPAHFEYVVHTREFIDSIKQQAFACMNSADGWCSLQKGELLVDLILKNKPQTVVEIGVYEGKSLLPMACALRANGAGQIYGIDPWDSENSVEESHNEDNKAFWGRVDHEAVLQRLLAHIEQFHLEGQIQLIRSTSADAPPLFDIDVLHIDGNHSDKTSYFDVTHWVPLVKKGGWIILDDMTWWEAGVFTTARAAEWLNANCIKFAEFTDNAVWGVWVKP